MRTQNLSETHKFVSGTKKNVFTVNREIWFDIIEIRSKGQRRALAYYFRIKYPNTILVALYKQTNQANHVSAFDLPLYFTTKNNAV